MVENGQTERTRRVPAIVVGLVVAALLAGALLVALRPFDLTVVPGGGSSGAAAKALGVSGTCDAAATTAFDDGSKDHLALWAVTVGTNMMGYTPVFGSSVKYVLLDGKESAFPGPYCVPEARHRMIWAVTLLTVGLAVVTVAVLLARRRAYVRP